MGITIDLRSDTVTRPSDAMREAMAKAPVADDVIDRDPTVAALEERTAELLGQEAGLFTPSGSMANLVALMVRLRPGDRFLAPAHAHVLSHELGTASWVAGGMPLELPWSHAPGVPSPADIDAIAAEEGSEHAYYELKTALVCLENSHNHGGGHIIRREWSDQLVAAAHRAGWPVHLDGARIWHAAAAQGLEPAEAAGAVDSVTVCFSKGLGAPVGSMILGSRQFVERGRRARKALGGGLRQSGVLAAAALVALDQELPRIDQDRLRAVRLAATLRRAGLDAPEPESNIIMVRPLEDSPESARDLAAAWNAAGVGCLVMGDAVRLVTHRDVGDAEIALAAEILAAPVS
jgi:threonine aldolase